MASISTFDKYQNIRTTKTEKKTKRFIFPQVFYFHVKYFLLRKISVTFRHGRSLPFLKIGNLIGKYHGIT